jgi:hypothetical protein
VRALHRGRPKLTAARYRAASATLRRVATGGHPWLAALAEVKLDELEAAARAARIVTRLSSR